MLQLVVVWRFLWSTPLQLWPLFSHLPYSHSVPELKCLTDKELLKIADVLQEVCPYLIKYVHARTYIQLYILQSNMTSYMSLPPYHYMCIVAICRECPESEQSS